MDMKYIKRFAEISHKDGAIVGGKNASLGEMYSSLQEAGVRVPNGFAVVADAYNYLVEYNKLGDRIRDMLDATDLSNIAQLAKAGQTIRGWIMHCTLPEDLAEEIRAAYRDLAEEYGPHPDVAVRSSATAEDLPTASYAGQLETYLNISGHENLLNACRRVFASLFTDRAISYRESQGFPHDELAVSVGVQKMVRADSGASGVMFTLDTESGFRDVIFITAGYGLGENVVQGTINPDEYHVFKPALARGYRAIIRRQLGDKALRLIYSKDSAAGISTHNVNVSREQRDRFCLSDEDVLQLARYGVAIEKHYSALRGTPAPMDIEWASDGETGELYILQARPETVHARKDPTVYETFTLAQRGQVLCSGRSVGSRIATGNVRVILNTDDMQTLQPGEILVTDITDPDWEPIMKIASGIVTNRGGRTCHAAIISRELGIPAVVGCGDATQALRNAMEVTLSCAEGDVGYIYKGILPFTVEKVALDNLGKTATRIMINLGNPEQAYAASFLPCDGIGLARLEFIINNSIKIHPRALLDYVKLDKETRQQIDEITRGYTDPVQYYIERLAEGIGTLAAAFHPREVIVRLSDFKSNEYAGLIGGEQFEPQEENPMIGFRGAFRYPSEMFADCFRLECQALRKVREVLGLDNISVMVPFVRSTDEAQKVLALMEENGIGRGNNGLRVYLMCELPVNALLAERFLEHFDGFSIGSNDLTQLTLGVDRDSGLVTGFDERNEAVLQLMAMAIDACRKHGKYVGICGQGPSDYPEITRWLVEKGISSISLNPDAVPKMIGVVREAESGRT